MLPTCTYTLDPRTWNHKEISYAPDQLRQQRPRLFILTDEPQAWVPDCVNLMDGMVFSLDRFSDDQIAQCAFYVYFSTADRAYEPLKRIIKCGGLFAPPPDFGPKPFWFFSSVTQQTMNEVAERMGDRFYSDPQTCVQLCQAVEMTAQLPGDLLELGVFSGTTASVMTTHMKNLGITRDCYFMDTWSGFSYDQAQHSADGIWKNTHHTQFPDGQSWVSNLLKPTQQRVHMLTGNICDRQVPEQISQLALVHVDVDMYDAVKAALETCAPLVVPKGVIVLDDPTSVPGLYGAWVALKEFTETELGSQFVLVQTNPTHFLIRVHT